MSKDNLRKSLFWLTVPETFIHHSVEAWQQGANMVVGAGSREITVELADRK